MKIGLIGLSGVGKTTIFNLLANTKAATGAYGAKDVNVGMAKVPDKRMDFLVGLYEPRKVSFAQIEFIDIAGVVPEGGSRKFLDDVRDCDAIVHVIRAFENPDVPHVANEINPAKDLETVDMELLFADLELIEKRIERIKTGKKVKKEQQEELVLLERLYKHLEAGGDIRQVELTEEEEKQLRAYSFLTEKPKLAVVNVDESQFKNNNYPAKEELIQLCRRKDMPLIEICGQIEAEIGELTEEDKELFMEDLGITETGIERLARAVYEHLVLISFFTVGEDEVKAWTINKGTTAKKAAGKIHSDIERGFIRAEVVKYRDIHELGSMAKVREQGLFRLEGKDYIL
ncbi:MAG: redox-regulated ATPase YchF [Clostridia bacterium]|nr:redox-regulated ATPase YchF [Clostridia bacterium]